MGDRRNDLLFFGAPKDSALFLRWEARSSEGWPTFVTAEPSGRAKARRFLITQVYYSEDRGMWMVWFDRGPGGRGWTPEGEAAIVARGWLPGWERLADREPRAERKGADG